MNTEQPGSQWFDTALPFLRQAGVPCDMNAVGAAAQRAEGIDVIELRLGLRREPVLAARLSGAKPIDLVFMGSITPRREAILAEMSDVLSQIQCRLLLFEASKPLTQDAHAGFVSGAAKLDLLARTRVHPESSSE